MRNNMSSIFHKSKNLIAHLKVSYVYVILCKFLSSGFSENPFDYFRNIDADLYYFLLRTHTNLSYKKTPN